MWQDAATFADRMATARTFRVFPGEGVHSDTLAALVRALDGIGYRGDYSFEVFNDDYQQLPLPVVCRRAFDSAAWVSQVVLRALGEEPGADVESGSAATAAAGLGAAVEEGNT